MESISDIFLKSVAQQVITAQKDDVPVTVNQRLEDLEVAARKKLFELLQENIIRNEGEGNDKGTSDYNVVHNVGIYWKKILDLCHHVLHFSLISPPTSTKCYDDMANCRRLPFLLLSDCLEGLPTLEDAQNFWSDYVEPELVDTLFGDKFWCALTATNNSKKVCLPGSHLPFLKVTNNFLKRLKYSPDNSSRIEWKGRILWALSKGFAIADKSSIKLWGNYHTTNATDYESREEFEKRQKTNDNPVKNTDAYLIKYNIYEAFWSLQHDFSNPNSIQVAEFINKLRLILETMESATSIYKVPETVIQKKSCSNQTKYLTSSALLPSQMGDPVFRSGVLTQFLIIASHLGAESPPLKNALTGLVDRACKLLQYDNPQLHKILWDSILANGREDDWRQWKKQKCRAIVFAPNFKRGNILDLGITKDNKNNELSNIRKRSFDRLHEDDSCSKNEKGACDSFASSSYHKYLDRSKDLDQKIPTLKQHLEPYVEALDPESGIEDEYHPKNNSLFTWRAMRLYAKHQLPLMSQCREPADLEKITRVWYRNMSGEEIPGEISSQLLNDDNCMEVTSLADDNETGNSIVHDDVGRKDFKNQDEIGIMLSPKINTERANDTEIKVDTLTQNQSSQNDITKTYIPITTDHVKKGEIQLAEEDNDHVIGSVKISTKLTTTDLNNDSYQPSDTKLSEVAAKTKLATKQGQEKFKNVQRANDGGRNERGRRDEGPMSSRNKTEENSHRGKPEIVQTTRGGGRYDDDYHDGSGRQKGRGERYSGDKNNSGGGRDNYRGNTIGGNNGIERGGGNNREGNRIGEKNVGRNRRNNDNNRSSRGSSGNRRHR